MASLRNPQIIEASAVGRRPFASAFRVVVSVVFVALALLLIGHLADWSQLEVAVGQLAGQPWLLAILVLAYTGSFLMRAVAWRALSSGCIGPYRLFVSIQAGLLVNHLTPVKLGKIARPLLAMRHSLGFGILPGAVRTRLELLQTQLRQVSARQIAHAASWTLPSWDLEAAVIIIAAKALGIELSIVTAVAVTAFTILFQVFHVTPGGLGVCEAVMTGALYAHGNHFSLEIPAGLGGVGSVIRGATTGANGLRRGRAIASSGADFANRKGCYGATNIGARHRDANPGGAHRRREPYSNRILRALTVTGSSIAGGIRRINRG